MEKMFNKSVIVNIIFICVVCSISAPAVQAGTLSVLNSDRAREEVEQEKTVEEVTPEVEEEVIDPDLVDLIIGRLTVDRDIVKVQVYNLQEAGPVLKNIKVTYYVWEDRFAGYDDDESYKRKKAGDSYIEELPPGVLNYRKTSFKLPYWDKDKEIEVIVNEGKIIPETDSDNNVKIGGTRRMKKQDTIFRQKLGLEDLEIEYGERL